MKDLSTLKNAFNNFADAITDSKIPEEFTMNINAFIDESLNPIEVFKPIATGKNNIICESGIPGWVLKFTTSIDDYNKKEILALEDDLYIYADSFFADFPEEFKPPGYVACILQEKVTPLKTTLDDWLQDVTKDYRRYNLAFTILKEEMSEHCCYEADREQLQKLAAEEYDEETFKEDYKDRISESHCGYVGNKPVIIL